MDWSEARQSTVDLWKGIRDAIGSAEELELLTEINAVCGLCEKARESTEHGEGPCRYCLAYQQFGGCQAASLEMSDLVVQGRWDELKELSDRFISQLETMEIPEMGSNTRQA